MTARTFVPAHPAPAQPLPVRCAGRRFRSGLAARCAVLFDALGVAWEYAPEGFAACGAPCPADFWLPARRVWVGVKPRYDERAFRLLGQLVAATDCAAGFLLCGLDDRRSRWVAAAPRPRLWQRLIGLNARALALHALDPQHKGFRVEDGAAHFVPLLWLADGDEAALAAAVQAARSARFARDAGAPARTDAERSLP